MSLALRVCFYCVRREAIWASYNPVDSSSQNEHSGRCDVAVKCVYSMSMLFGCCGKRASLFQFPCVYACVPVYVYGVAVASIRHIQHSTIQQTHAHTSCLTQMLRKWNSLMGFGRAKAARVSKMKATVWHVTNFEIEPYTTSPVKQHNDTLSVLHWACMRVLDISYHVITLTNDYSYFEFSKLSARCSCVCVCMCACLYASVVRPLDNSEPTNHRVIQFELFWRNSNRNSYFSFEILFVSIWFSIEREHISEISFILLRNRRKQMCMKTSHPVCNESLTHSLFISVFHCAVCAKPIMSTKYVER